ncbi:hypothetical protein ACFOZ7_15040 [Natribaculum luteum]|uniref:MFS transporter n=1 Tax=Natribaculum luteum TaxID=1586232 RepID=A0ABD5P1N6_9EURY|nr:hypothetical protein [Natribaculum luteum]
MRRSALNVVLAVGFLALSVAVLLARATPATGYEASIYAATPTGTWVALAVAFAVAIGVTLVARGRYQALGIVLGSTAVTTVVALPVIRNYRYMGMGDALTHLGWTKDFLSGAMLPHELLYPGMHSLATLLHLTGGVSPDRGLLLAVVFVFVPFVVFVPLIVRDVTGNATAVGFAAIVSWFVLPVNKVATHMGIHTNSNALFFVPVVVFAVVAYTRRRAALEALPVGLSPYTVLVIVGGAGLLLIHPQQMVNVVIVLAVISLVQYAARRRLDDHPILEHPTTYAHTFVLGTLFVVWVASNERFRNAFLGLIYGLFARDIGAGGEVDQRGSSLTEIGGSLTELFAKMFLVSAVVGLVVGLFVLFTWLGWTSLDRETKAFVTYFGVALFPLTAMFVVYFVGTPTMAFRQVGFVYVLITILAGVALAHLFGWLSGPITTPGANALAAVFLGACLVLGLLTIFTSPFIYSPTQHVTDQKMSGYESAFDRTDGRAYAGFGFGVERYGDGINGVEGAENVTYAGEGEGVVDVDEFENESYGSAYDGEYYFVATEYDVEREIEVYRELHHSESALRGIDTYPGANKVISNDEFRMYSVESAA